MSDVLFQVELYAYTHSTKKKLALLKDLALVHLYTCILCHTVQMSCCQYYMQMS